VQRSGYETVVRRQKMVSNSMAVTFSESIALLFVVAFVARNLSDFIAEPVPILHWGNRREYRESHIDLSTFQD